MDIFSTPHRIQWRHKKGFNVLYGDGSAKWTDDDLLMSIESAPFSTTVSSMTIIPYRTLPQNFTTTANGTMIRALAASRRRVQVTPAARMDPRTLPCLRQTRLAGAIFWWTSRHLFVMSGLRNTVL